MPRINLLPWREQRRRQRQREFFIILAGALLISLGGVVQWYLHYESLIKHQQQRNRFLQQQITAVDRQIKEIRDIEKTRRQLVARMDVIQNLQTSRPQIVHLFDELVSTLPEGVYLTSLRQNGAAITISGRSQSNARVSSYMRNIESSDWLADPKLTVVENRERNEIGLNEFNLSAKQVVPGEDKSP